MKKTEIKILIIALSLCILSSCAIKIDGGSSGGTNSGGQSGGSSAEEEREIAIYSDEDDGTKLKTKKKESSFFVGTWVAESERAAEMYGNVNITINEDGTWDGDITEEIIHGTWSPSGDGISLTSDVIPFRMVYSSNDNVVLQEVEEEEMKVVLTRQ